MKKAFRQPRIGEKSKTFECDHLHIASKFWMRLNAKQNFKIHEFCPYYWEISRHLNDTACDWLRGKFLVNSNVFNARVRIHLNAIECEWINVRRFREDWTLLNARFRINLNAVKFKWMRGKVKEAVKFWMRGFEFVQIFRLCKPTWILSKAKRRIKI